MSTLEDLHAFVASVIVGVIKGLEPATDLRPHQIEPHHELQNDLGVDSIGRAEIVMELEARRQHVIHISEEAFTGWQTVGDITLTVRTLENNLSTEDHAFFLIDQVAGEKARHRQPTSPILDRRKKHHVAGLRLGAFQLI